MKRHIGTGAVYALVVTGFLTAETWTVTVNEANVVSEPGPFAERVEGVVFGDNVETTGAEQDDYLPVKLANGKTGWIARASVMTPGSFKAGAAGEGAEAGKEGAYVKGFDPEVEAKYREDNPSLSQAYDTDVLPLIYETRGSAELERAEEELERLQLQAKGASPEAQALKSKVASLRAANQPFWDKWSADLREFRRKGQIGEFAGRK
jgi:hypothetical protein